MRVPDYISPIVAWRVWQSDSAGLKSLNGEPWLPGKRLRARCVANAECQFHEAPQFDCTCGIYGSKSLDHLRRTQFWRYGSIHGEVNLWGSVVEHEAGFRAEFGHPKILHLPSETLPVTLKQIEIRIQSLVGYGCDLFIVGQSSTIPLWRKASGFNAAGLDFLMSRGQEWYVRRRHERTLKIGDRIAVFGRGIALVEKIGDVHIDAILWNRTSLKLRRRELVWNEQNFRWESVSTAVLSAT